MCRFCAKARMSAENDIYSSFLNDLDHEDSADYEISAHTRVNPGKFNAVPGSAAWKAQRSSTQKARADANALSSGSTSALPTSLSREEKREAELCASLRRRRIPTVILTGFLGSGKTTLLNRLLDSTKLRLAVIENEVGAVSVDDKLIETPSSGFSAGAGDGDSRGAGGGAGGLFQPGTQRAKEVVLLPNGCMCCRVRGDLRDAFKRIVKTAYSPQASRSAPEGNPTGTPPPTSQMKRGLDGLVLELSGLSELGPVVQTFFSDTFVQGTLGIDSIVCVIDVSNLKRTLSQGSGLIFEQLSLADTVVLNKIDLLEGNVSGAEYRGLVAIVRSVNPTARLLPLSLADKGTALPSHVFGPDAFMKTQAFSSGVVLSPGEDHGDSIFGNETSSANSTEKQDGDGHDHGHGHDEGGGSEKASSSTQENHHGHDDDDHHHHHHQQQQHHHHHDTMGYSSFCVDITYDSAGKPALVDRSKLLTFLDDMHDEGKRQFLASKTGEAAKAKLEDTISPIIRCKGILRDTNGKRVALQGLYEHHEFFELGDARPSSTERADTDTTSSDSAGKTSPAPNQLVFIGPITAKFQATIRAAAVACFTNAEAVAADQRRVEQAKKAAYSANNRYFARAMEARSSKTASSSSNSAPAAVAAMGSHRDTTSFLRKGFADDIDLGMDMF